MNYLYVIVTCLILNRISAQTIVPLSAKGEDNKFIFDSLKNTIGNKRIICLGESAHRVETFIRFKTELIKYLHDDLGYEVVAFESNLFNVTNGYYNIQSDTGALKESLYSIWRTASVLDLFRYVKKTKETKKPLILTGFDVKSGLSYSTSAWLKVIIMSGNSKYAESVFSTDTMLINRCARYEHNLKFIPETEGANYQAYYASLIDSLETYKTGLLNQQVLTEIQFKIIRQCLQNRINLAKFLCSKDLWAANDIRDSIMAQNILWLVNDLYKDKKIVLWAHNAHISKKTVEHGTFHTKSSVEMFSEELKNQVETISLDFVKNAPKRYRVQIESMPGNAFLINHPGFMNGAFEAVILFKETEAIDKYKIN